jgi:hypothetical protein
MTQYNPYPPVQTPQPATPPSNGLGTAGFVVGLVGLVLSPIPIIDYFAWPLVVLGIIFSAIGIARVSKGKATNKGLSIAGLAVSVIGLVICIVWATVITKTANDINDEANRTVDVSYEVTGDAKDVDISYSTFDANNVSPHEEHAATLPWSKKVQSKGLIKGGTLLVTAGEAGGTVTCKVTVDGKEAATDTASGPLAIATCAGF